MKINLEIAEGYSSLVSKKVITNAARVTLQHQDVPSNAGFTIVITSDELIQELNREYRDIDVPTDVLSFQADTIDPENGALYLGDVLISYPHAEIQATAGGHSTEDELQLLVVHGILHLLGYDHAYPDEKEEMWTAQEDIRAQLGKAGIAP